MTAHEEHSKYLFISDLHLGGFDSQKNIFLENTFVDIVDFALKNKFRIIIHGDLLDYYMQYGDWIPDVARIPFKVLHHFNQQSSFPAVYITGNHDNWDSGYIENIGCIHCPESYEINIDGKKTFIAHGDGLKDPKYQFPRPFFHRVLRNQYFVSMFKFLTSPRLGNRIMKKFSMLNRNYFTEQENHSNKLDSWAASLLKNFNFDVVICGHHHQLRRIQTSHGVYINTGSFYDDLTFAIYTNTGFELVYWNSNTKEISPRIIPD